MRSARRNASSIVSLLDAYIARNRAYDAEAIELRRCPEGYRYSRFCELYRGWASRRIRSAERMTGTHRDTICRLLVEVGEGCAKLMDEQMRELSCRRIRGCVDETAGSGSQCRADVRGNGAVYVRTASEDVSSHLALRFSRLAKRATGLFLVTP